MIHVQLPDDERWLSKLRARYLLALLIAIVSGCSAAPKYYKTATPLGVWGEDAVVEFDVQIDPTPPTTSPTPLALSERGQAAFITAMSASDEGRASLLRSLASPITAGSSPARIDYSRTRLSRRVTFVIRTRRFHEADRITEATVDLNLPAGWRVRSYSNYSETRTPLKLATITNTAKQSLAPSLTLPISTEPGAAGGLESSESTVRELGVEVVELLPILRDRRASFTLRAPYPQINVAGRYSIDMTIEPEEFTLTRVVSFKWNGSDPDSLRSTLVASTTESNPRLTVEYEYVLRRVFGATSDYTSDGLRTITEDDDRVRYELETGKLDGERVIADDEALRSEAILIEVADGRPLLLVDPDFPPPPGLETCVVFSDPREAVKFRDWLLGDMTGRQSGPNWRLRVRNPSDRSLEDRPSNGGLVLRSLNLRAGGLPSGCRPPGT